MKKILLFCIIGLLCPAVTMPARKTVRITPAAQRRLEKIKKAEEMRKHASHTKPERFKRAKRNLGYIRHMPNKVVKIGGKPNEGFLVNKNNQKFPVIISDKKSGSGFFLGAFYDIDDWTLRYVYLK